MDRESTLSNYGNATIDNAYKGLPPKQKRKFRERLEQFHGNTADEADTNDSSVLGKCCSV